MSVQVELRFSSIAPPTPEPPHSLYADLVNLPNPLKLGLTVRIFNYDSVTLYMRVDGYGGSWTFTSNDLGAWAAGTDQYRNLDQFGSRAKPASETTETVTVRLRAYTDAGYTVLKWTYERSIELVFIKSDDGSWTQNFLNNFDDGTLQGWAVVKDWADGLGTTPSVAVQTDYVLSVPYCARAYYRMDSINPGSHGIRLYKSFATPNKNKVYAVIDVRARRTRVSGTAGYSKWYGFRFAGTMIVFIGRPVDYVATDYVPFDKWMRIVIPLTPNVTQEVHIVFTEAQAGSGINDLYLWIDDFKIISKD